MSKSIIALAADYFRIQAKILKEDYFNGKKWTNKDAKEDHETHMIMFKELEQMNNSGSYSLKSRRKQIFMYKCDSCTAWFSTATKMRCECGKCDPEDDDVMFPCHECDTGSIQLACVSFDTHCRILKEQEDGNMKKIDINKSQMVH